MKAVERAVGRTGGGEKGGCKGGLVLAPGVDPNVWTIVEDNSGPNGLLKVTAVSSTPKLIWNGTPSGNWEIGNTANWQGGATYTEPAEVTFDSTLAGVSTVNLTTTLSPLAIVVNNPTTSYIFSGTGKISGTAGLTKEGAGSLTLNNSGGNDFTGSVNLNAGSVTLAHASALGSNSGVLNVNGSTLDLGTFTVTKGAVNSTGGTITNGTLAGASTTLTKTGSGTLVLNGSNTYDGLTTITGGTVKLGSATALGSTTGGTAFSSGTLDLNGLIIDEPFTANPGTFVNSNATIRAEITTEMVDQGNLTVDGPGDLVFNNVRRVVVSQQRIFKNGAGTLTLGGTISNARYGLTVNEGNVLLNKPDGVEAVGRHALIMNNALSKVTLLASNQIHNNTDVLSTAKNGLHQINAGTLDLNGFDDGIGGLGTSTTTDPGGIVTNSNLATPSTLSILGLTTLDASDTTAIFPGTISGNLNLVKQGANAQALTGTNTYIGTTTVSGGYLIIGKASSIPAGGVGVTVLADAGFGFVPAGLSDTEISTIISKVTWDANADLVFSVSAPDTELVSADLSGFTGSTIILRGGGTLDITGATLPAGVTYQTPDGGTIIGAPIPELVIDSVIVGAGSISGFKVTLSFTAGVDVDAYASDSLQRGNWTLVASAIASSPAEVEDNINSTKRFYVLVPAGSGNPYP